MNLPEMVRRGREVVENVVEAVFLESDLRRAREWRVRLEETYGTDARNRQPVLYGMVESTYLIRGGEIALAALIVGGLCAWVTGVLK